MNPILIISHIACEHPGYLCEYLDKQGITYINHLHEDGTRLPAQVADYAGLILLGSPVSVNDSLQWINDELKLINSFLAEGIPILGICFGAQLMAKALGGEVYPAPSMQIGWHPIRSTKRTMSIFGDIPFKDTFHAFEWHGDTFSLPNGSIPLFTGECIKNQGFLYKNCIALQFHPEITETMVHEWLNRYKHCLNKSSMCIQNRAKVLKNMSENLASQRLIADKLFGWWFDKVYEHQLVHKNEDLSPTMID
jgi:GMP synthase-like glutamine amidotransferase